MLLYAQDNMIQNFRNRCFHLSRLWLGRERTTEFDSNPLETPFEHSNLEVDNVCDVHASEQIQKPVRSI